MTHEQGIILRWVGYFGVTLIFWFGLFFWSRYVAYPLELKKRIKKGKSWMYIPLWWKESSVRQNWTRVGTVFIVLLAVCSAVISLWHNISQIAPVAPFLALPFAFLAWFLFRKSVAYVPNLEVDCYYFLNGQLAKDYEHAFSETELKNRTTWKFNYLLLKADKRHRFLKYVKAMAVSGKVREEEWSEEEEKNESGSL
ncbi:MAG: hypothetical protein LBR60_07395 [Fibrobacter sp.]|jgi:hypothetical protein|nr:hypothetical protein [Fibrobacter sp.]